MRKIKYTVLLNPDTFTATAKCKMKLDNSELVTIFEKDMEVEDTVYTYLGKKYSREQVEQIEFINEEISKLGMVPLTVEEADYMFNWDKIPDVKDTETLQRLSGFKVEKVVTYLD